MSKLLNKKSKIFSKKYIICFSLIVLGVTLIIGTIAFQKSYAAYSDWGGYTNGSCNANKIATTAAGSFYIHLAKDGTKYASDLVTVTPATAGSGANGSNALYVSLTQAARYWQFKDSSATNVDVGRDGTGTTNFTSNTKSIDFGTNEYNYVFVAPSLKIKVPKGYSCASATAGYNKTWGYVLLHPYKGNSTVATNEGLCSNLGPWEEDHWVEGWLGVHLGGTGVITQNNDSGSNYCFVKQSLNINFTAYSWPITYKLNSGTVSGNPATYKVSSSTITLKNPTRTGYTFTGWTGSNGSTAQTSVTIPSGSTGNRSYTANWTANTYNIGYTLNGGTHGTNHPTSGTYGSVVTISNPTKTVTVTGDVNGTGATIEEATSKAQSFGGWTSTTLSATAEAGSTSGSTAHWHGGNKLHYMYYKNLRSDTGTATMVANWNPVAFNLPTISKTGYTCKWNTKSDGAGTSYNSKELYTPTANSAASVTMYAICTENPITNITVTYQSDAHGTVDANSESVAQNGNPVGTTTTPRDGYRLKGWRCNKDVTLNNDTVITSGNLITKEQLTTIKVTEAITLTAEHEIAPDEGIPTTMHVIRKVNGSSGNVTNEFTYTITPDPNNSASVTGIPTTFKINFNNEPSIEDVAQKGVYIDFDDAVYTKPGDYKFTISETASGNSNVYPVTSDEYEVYVSVRYKKSNGEPTKELIVKSLVKKRKGEEAKTEGSLIFEESSIFTYITIKKDVEGNMGDIEKYFKVKVNINGATGDVYNITGQTYQGQGVQSTYTVGQGDQYIWLKHGETVYIGKHNNEGQIRTGVTYNFVEDSTDAAAYETYINESSTNSKSSGNLTTDTNIENNVNSILNVYEKDTMTGKFLKASPYIAISLIAIAGIVFIIVKKVRVKEEE